MKYTNFKMCDAVIGISVYEKLLFDCFFWIVDRIKIKFGQMLLQVTTDISKWFWAKFWSRKLVPGLFMILIKWQYHEIC